MPTDCCEIKGEECLIPDESVEFMEEDQPLLIATIPELESSSLSTETIQNSDEFDTKYNSSDSESSVNTIAETEYDTPEHDKTKSEASSDSNQRLAESPDTRTQRSYKSPLKKHAQTPIDKIGNKAASSHACSQCDYEAPNQVDLFNHTDAVHKESRPHACKECDYKALHKVHLLSHVNAVHRGLKPYACEECNYTSSWMGNLHGHINAVHRGLKPYACSVCDYHASRRNLLKTHIDAVHKKLKPHACPECNFKTAHKGDLTVHIKSLHRRMTGVDSQDSRQRRTASDLTQHTPSIQAIHDYGVKSPCESSRAEHDINEVTGDNESRSRIIADSLPISKGISCRLCSFKAKTQAKINFHFEVAHQRGHIRDLTDSNSKHSKETRQYANKSNHTIYTQTSEGSDDHGSETPNMLNEVEETNNLIDLTESTEDDESDGRSDAEQYFPQTIIKGKRKKRTETKAYFCKRCEYVTTLKECIQKHIGSAHGRLENHACTESADDNENDGGSEAEQYFLQTISKWKRMKKTELNAYFCTKCEYVTTLKEGLLKHICSSHGSLKKPVCTESTDDDENDGGSDAEQYFSQTISKGKRMKMTETKAYFCKRCEYVTTLKECLLNHISSSHGRLERHACTECEFVAATSDKLLLHIHGAHKNIRPYACESCDSAFKTEWILNKHVSLVHKDINEIPELRGPTQMGLSDMQTRSMPKQSFNEKTLVQEDFDCANNIIKTDFAGNPPAYFANQQTNSNSVNEFHSKQRTLERTQNSSDVSGDAANLQISDEVTISIMEFQTIGPNDQSSVEYDLPQSSIVKFQARSHIDKSPAEYDLSQDMRATSDNEKTAEFINENMRSLMHFPCSSCLFRANTQAKLMSHIMSDHQDDCI